MKTRFAPSPTGALHLGHAASALHVWRAAEAVGGTVLLRIEDIDTTRCKPELSEAIYRDLAWLGFDWPTPVRVQSDHFAAYADVVAGLATRGLAYRCFRTRAELVAKDPAPIAPSEEQACIDAGRPYAWRLSLDAARDQLGRAWHDLSYTVQTDRGIQSCQADPARHGDIVIARKDSPSAYHLAATHDDALQGITHVIRGTDLEDAPHIHTLLQVLMDWPQPVYQHHPLVLDVAGKRLSKRGESPSLAALRRDDMSIEDIKQRLGFA